MLRRRSMTLRKGDIVVLRSPAEILATLDEEGRLEGVLFMPEMLRYFGARLAVSARVKQACDTIEHYEARRMPATVLLEDLRCDGSAHGGCQAGCRLYWKEAWLTRITGGASRGMDHSASALAELEARVRSNAQPITRRESGREQKDLRCQATEFLRATQPLGSYDPKSFVRELTCGNVGLRVWLRVTLRAVRVAISRKLRLHIPEAFHPLLGRYRNTRPRSPCGPQQSIQGQAQSRDRRDPRRRWKDARARIRQRDGAVLRQNAHRPAAC